ncbi:hypothetical protein ACFP1I_07320 [Dyadobacter subterraneus]|jgi:hypothetical protein|uniref:Uncharacterized protein n=1 Tax=Dyadobacter subterraneus TaxID=2773304 RepID=A0ABR9WF87_9BACT|nr:MULTISPECIES: hypothetical protein [Dyadobacter]MBE9464058.1 hypothetical protein [Dyadobacter subterraneus]MCF0056417.1 hypothetical protein [Dyadobacter sp. CY356]
MAKVNLDVPDKVHLKAKQLQLELEENDQRITLQELYKELVIIGLEAMKKKMSNGHVLSDSKGYTAIAS